MRSSFSDYLMLVTSSYLPLKKVLLDIRTLSSKVKKILTNSKIASENKVMWWKIDAVKECLLHREKLQLALARRMPILELTSVVKFVIICDLESESQNCHKSYDCLSEVLLELPTSFDKNRISVDFCCEPICTDWAKLAYIL